MKPLLLATLVPLFVASAVLAEDIAPFAYVDTSPPALLLNGVIDMRTPLAFRRAMKAHPDARILALNSAGGAVQAGLLIAEDVHEHGYQTVVPETGQCVSACSFIFFAGKDRLAVGRLGVHQIFGLDSDQDTQTNLSDVVEALTRYGVDNAVLTTMLRTPSSGMHYFTQEEIARMGINRMAQDSQQDYAAASESSERIEASLPNDENTNSAFVPLRVPIPADKPVYAALPASGAAVDIVVAFLTSAQRSASEVEKAALKTYATTVLVDGTVVSREALARHLKGYATEWPERRIVVDLQSIRQSCRDRLCDIKGRYEYFQARSGAEQLRGSVDFTFEVETGGMTIVTHNEIRNRIR